MAHQVILADNQAIFRAGVARVLGQERNLQVVAQCPDYERLKEAVGTLRKSIVIYPSSFAPDMNELLDWIEQAGSRSVVILEHGATLDGRTSPRGGTVLRSVAAPQLVDCLLRVAAGQRSVQRANLKTMPSPDRVGTNVLERLTPKDCRSWR